MPLTLEKGREILKKTIQKDIRHRDYKRVCELAEKYLNYTTGEDIRKLLKKFVPNESDALFDQREAITSLTTPDIVNTLINPMYQMGRTTANIDIHWDDKGKNEANKKTLEEINSKFWGDTSLEKYLTVRMPALDLDANSFIVSEFSGSVDPAKPETKAKPYPFEVNSKEAINYKFENNLLQFLIVLNEDETKHTLYLENESVTATKIKKEELAEYQANNSGGEVWYKDENNKDDEYVYFVEVFKHKAGRIPARRVGTILDPMTRQRTCVPMIHVADVYLKKAIKTVSEFDLTTALHTFPKTFRYGKPCRGDMEKGLICNEGLTHENKKCSVCKGSGWDAMTTTATETIVRAPKDLKDIVNLENMLAYKAPPPELIEFQKKYGLYELRECAIKSVYNSDTYVRDTTAATATEKNIDLEAVYTTVRPFGDSWSAMYVHLTLVNAAYCDLGKGLTVEHSFPKDMKMKSLSMLLDDLKKANDCGAPSYMKAAINNDILRKLYIDHPDELLKIQVKEKFFPFNGKSENEVNTILAGQFVAKFDRVFYAKFDSFFTEIENEVNTDKVNFYEMDYKKQKELIRNKVNEYLAALDKEDEDARAAAFGSKPIPGEGGTTEEEEEETLTE